MTDSKKQTHYLPVLAIVCVIAMGLAFCLNAVVDPLWYYAGNRVADKNFVFNERLSKTNRFIANSHQYDCVIFGNSRVTLLPEEQIRRFRCFNFSFSNGLVGDFVEFARYVKEQGFKPVLVVVGVDGINFAQQTPYDTVPDFVLSRDRPPGVIASYLSADAVDFSVRTLLDRSPFPRYYDARFSGAIRSDAPKYDPDTTYVSQRAYEQLQNLKFYRELRDVFGDAEFLAYVPPLSVWRMKKYQRWGTLESYLKAVHLVSTEFPELVDFSYPGSETARIDNTYDGSHYDLPTNAKIAEWIETGRHSFGERPSGFTAAEYAASYIDDLNSFDSAMLR